MKFVNLPKELSRKFYKKCKNEFIELCRKNSDIVSVYEAGSVSVPGISDLDFILCLKDKLKNKKEVIENQLTNGLKDIIGEGSILKINKANFSNLKLWDDFTMRYLYGGKFKFAEFNSKEFEICRILDWLPERLHSLLKFKKERKINVTRGLQLIKSASVSLDKLSKLTGSVRYESLSKDIKKLRSNWFKNKNENNLRDFRNLLEKSADTILDAINEMDKFLIKNNYIFGDFSKAGESFKIKNGPEFFFGQEVEIREGKIFLPRSFFFFFAAQTLLGDGFISDNLKKSFDKKLPRLAIKGHINKKLLGVMKKRAQYIDRVANFFKKNEIKKGLLKYGWFLKG